MSSQWIIGDNKPPPACYIYRTRDTSPPGKIGNKRDKFGIVARFTY